MDKTKGVLKGHRTGEKGREEVGSDLLGKNPGGKG